MGNDNADFLVFTNAGDGGYWTGDGWSSDPEDTLDVTAAEAASLALGAMPSEIHMPGDEEGSFVYVEEPAPGMGAVVLEYPDGREQLYGDKADAEEALAEYLGAWDA
jgi:hypothetical protein